ncbi:MAG TPA: F0F1 ATP synthase subunit A [Myxococcaceae bacterium]|nr:F0F1 ATP synthase subunit A [Myxococcaceae bacterium]
MRRVALIIPLLFAGAALAEPEAVPAAEHEGAAAEPAGEKHDVAGTIFHHVADSDELEIEVPFNPDRNIVFHLPHWRWNLKPGVCAAYPNDHGMGLLFKGCFDLSISKHAVMMWFATALLLVAFLFGANTDKRRLVPKGAGANLLEMMVLFVRDEIAVKNIGKDDGPRFTPYLLTIFFFILFMNLSGLIPEMSTATANLAVTAALAGCTFIVTQVASIRAAGFGGYLKHLTGGVHPLLWVIMIPVEFLGLFTKPFALTVRLFANMLAGHIVIFFLLGLIFIMGNVLVAGVSVPFAMGIYFLELFVALIQAYIFTMLSALFIGMGVAMGHHEHSHSHQAEAGHGHA